MYVDPTHNSLNSTKYITPRKTALKSKKQTVEIG